MSDTRQATERANELLLIPHMEDRSESFWFGAVGEMARAVHALAAALVRTAFGAPGAPTTTLRPLRSRSEEALPVTDEPAIRSLFAFRFARWWRWQMFRLRCWLAGERGGPDA